MTKAIVDLRSPTPKIVAFLKKGRDDLRIKYAALREKFRTAENQVRAVEKSREQWRRRAERAEAELRESKKKYAESG
jgi:chromosome segregation ATPase